VNIDSNPDPKVKRSSLSDCTFTFALLEEEKHGAIFVAM
jgi:hypothetical protein